MGISLISIALALSLSFFSYSPSDPTFIYGDKSAEINNLLGIYGGVVADFLLQSFGLVAFLFLITILIWGISLVVKKEIKNLKFKIFFLILYLIFTCIFVYITFNNSFWLIDNGNSGFVGQILYDSIIDIFPNINNEYIFSIFIILGSAFFILASNINIKYLWIPVKSILKIFKKNDISNTRSETIGDRVEDLIDKNPYTEVPQQTFSFEKVKESIDVNKNYPHLKNFKLPSIELLEKNPSKINLLDNSKNRPDGKFIEKILLDFGIDGKITKINNGPVVSLYEFEPAPGVKVSKIINLSDDLARNTSSTSARVSIIPGKNTVGIEIPNESRESVKGNNFK